MGPRVMESGVSPTSCVNNGDAHLHIRPVSSLQRQESRGHLGPFSPCPLPFPLSTHEQLIHREQLHSGVISCQNSCRGSSPSPLPFIPSALQEESASVSFKMRIGILFSPCLKPEGASCSLCKLFNWHMIFFFVEDGMFI